MTTGTTERTTPQGASPHVDVAALADRLRQAVETVVQGKPDVVRLAVTAMLAEGHLLVEDVPGVGKTLLAKALARASGARVSRIQCTPDLMPSDVTGVNVFNQQSRDFEFRPGGVFANVVLADEVNRASPKTQSALLEAMEERQVTVDGTTYPLSRPFLVLATQNPVEMEGTYPLPEAQRDRFMARLSMGYPSADDELALVHAHGGESTLDALEPVSDPHEVGAAIAAVHRVHLAEEVARYAVAVVRATRQVPTLRLGASPRASVHLVRAARARAAVDGRDFVLPDDVQALAVPVLAHRVLLGAEAMVARESGDQVVRSAVAGVAVPVPDRRAR